MPRSMPAVTTRSLTEILSVTGMFAMASGAESRPVTSPVARVRVSSPVTSERVSLMSMTAAQPLPTSVTLPASAPPSESTGAPLVMPASVPRSMVMTRSNCEACRLVTPAATVSNSRRSRISSKRERRRFSSTTASSVPSCSCSCWTLDRRARFSRRRLSISPKAPSTSVTARVPSESDSWTGVTA